jgi:hypothetical protein
LQSLNLSMKGHILTVPYGLLIRTIISGKITDSCITQINGDISQQEAINLYEKYKY